MIVQPEDRRFRVRVGDFLLINDRIAFYVEDGTSSDGYDRFGGEILAIDRVGEDGRPMGLSQYNETIFSLSNETVRPESVTVMSDGSEGGEAVIRVAGHLAPLPFLDGSLGALFPREYGLPVLIDYVLKPQAETMLVRLTLVNETSDALNFQFDEIHGFFHDNRSQLVTSEFGFVAPKGEVAHVAFDGGEWGFAWRSPNGPLYFSLEQSGYNMFNGPGFQVEPCAVATRDHAEIIAGGPYLDGLREAVRRADGDDSYRAVTGTVVDGAGQPVPDAWVIEHDGQGALLSRTKTDAAGAFIIHAPSASVTLVPYMQGFPSHAGTGLAADASDITLSFAAHGFVHVSASDPDDARALPVRVQVLPADEPEALPSSWGVTQERRGRLHQFDAIDGEATLRVPPGQHRVIVSRGYEYEIVDTTVTVTAGETTDVVAELVRSVDSTGWMCTDLHVHTFYSVDSDDSLQRKVSASAAEGLEITTISDHDWVTDPAPMVTALGLAPWMAGLTSLELTTFSWGHFGVVPISERTDASDNGAVDWTGKNPAEVFDMVDALPEKPALVVNHPRSSGFEGYFSATGYDREKGTGRADLWSDNFDLIEACNGSAFEDNRDDAVADWFSFLEHGRDIWAVGSSDNHHLVSGPVGYPRTCLYLGHDDPSKVDPDTVRDVLLSGAAVVGGGIFMTVEGPGGERPGQTRTGAGSSATFTVSVQAPSWVSATTLETIVNGETVDSTALLPIGDGPGQAFLQTVEVPVDATRARSWVVFHAKGDGSLDPIHPGRKPFAFSNPVFLVP